MRAILNLSSISLSNCPKKHQKSSKASVLNLPSPDGAVRCMNEMATQRRPITEVRGWAGIVAAYTI